jgi:ribosomal protein S18 acetylase RimI-like enzyme
MLCNTERGEGPLEVRVEPICRDDHEDLVALFREFAAFEKLPERMVNSAERMAREAEFLNGFVAKNDADEIVAYATCFFAYYTWTGKSLYMDDLYVRPEYRGRGLGSKLIREVIEFARTEGCHKVRWQVSNWNTPAIGFYRAIGAHIDDTERNCDLII